MSADEPILEIEHLSKSYDDQRVLDNVSLIIPKGDRVALMGPSGSGKSTLLNCIAGLEAPDSGSIRFMGQPLDLSDADAAAAFRREKLTSVFQFFHLLPTLSAAENVEFPLLLSRRPKKERQEKVRQLLNEVGLTHRAHAYPSQLSGGELQRLAIARALITEPTLLLADEPTGSLDSNNGQRVLDLLAELLDRHDAALLLVTHDFEAAVICRRTLNMRDGRLDARTSELPV